MQIEERVLISELNKMRLGKQRKADQQPVLDVKQTTVPEEIIQESFSDSDEWQEREIVRLLLTYGHELVHWDGITDSYIAPYVIANLSDVTFDNEICNKIIEAYKTGFEQGHLPSEQDFIRHRDPAISHLAISLISSPYVLSENWYAKRKIYVHNEKENLRVTILGGIFHLKKRKVDHILRNIMEEIQKETDPDNQAILMQRYMRVKEVEKGISNYLGSVILK
jgi:DNA primase